MNRLLSFVLGLLLTGCGSGGGSSGGGASLPPPAAPLVAVSNTTPFGNGCTNVSGSSTLYASAEEEPYIAADPSNAQRLLGAWQQDRFSNGGARGLLTAHSSDGGNTWSRVALPATVCAGGNTGNGGDWDRASDPWVAFGADGRAYAIALSFDFAGSNSTDNAVLVFRSLDGGATWGAPATLIADTVSNFNDKEAIAADPVDPNYAFAAWDRLTIDNRGPAMFSRTTNGGTSWSAAQVIYDPGVGNQTINNIPVVAPDGSVYVFFTRILRTPTSATELVIVRSTDHGATFGAPVVIASSLSVGTIDPNNGDPIREGSGLGSIAVGPSGELVATWQDSRFTGAFDGIVVSRSTNLGVTWSAPVLVNKAPTFRAFTPTAAIRADGRIGVTYFDMRNESGGDGRLDISYWIVTSSDLITWTETRVAQPFDLHLAPVARGLFLGDYMGLATSGSSFLPFYVQTNNAGTSDRTSVYTLPIGQLTTAMREALSFTAKSAPASSPTAADRQRSYDALMRTLSGRIPGWDERQARFEAAAAQASTEQR